MFNPFLEKFQPKEPIFFKEYPETVIVDKTEDFSLENIRKESLQNEINYTYDCLIDPFEFDEPFPYNYGDDDDLSNNIFEDEIEEEEEIDQDWLEYEMYLDDKFRY
jgi:hypothetical protein